jgi:hypothetical protein
MNCHLQSKEEYSEAIFLKCPLHSIPEWFCLGLVDQSGEGLVDSSCPRIVELSRKGIVEASCPRLVE